MQAPSPHIVAILLAAGRGKRFDPAGQQDKLLQRLPGGQSVAAQSAANLKSVFARVVAVVRPGQQQLLDVLGDAGCETTVCDDADQGMANSLRQGLALAGDAHAWVIALADMPFVQAATLQQLRAGLEQGHGIVAPTCGGRRGNPVGFSRQYLEALRELQGDAGARSLLASCPVHNVEVTDQGIFRDIDTPADLA
ncbi:nucleotidyltransferase family protein [Lacisediminimonas sp.]|uniref:nucleotidyltransferase family protein n=1 Tax=Lacisediminimonas sp. TaxID=3060582 RepID=UPI00271DCA29|nr:nucleotidyltransferase family protein [Lacisediminimonas sp.]MDO8299571.1 nucleotidyltransferase family protein [Lacisediminimonas sp.]MDO9217090.1 nucleotidyltransferase family protein [Lacisediminimonas sp.]